MNDKMMDKINIVLYYVVVYIYKRKHPDYEFKANDLYTKLLVVVILIECFYTAGFFN